MRSYKDIKIVSQYNPGSLRSRDVCSKPKSPRSHHCRSCGMCILDMDHHCPFIGNCVGAANHRCFILFLISTVISTLYVTIMTLYSAVHIWPPFEHTTLSQLGVLVDTEFIFIVLKDKILALLRSAVFLSVRGIVLVYLFMASVSVAAAQLHICRKDLFESSEGS